MSRRSKVCRNRYQRRPVQWQERFHTNMEKSFEVDQPRTFYDGQETLDSNSEETHESFVSYPTLSNQKTRANRSLKKKKNQVSFPVYSNRGWRNNKYSSRRSINEPELSYDSSGFKSVIQPEFSEVSSESQNFPSSTLEFITANQKVHRVEFLPKSVNTFQQGIQQNEKDNIFECENQSSDMFVHGTDPETRLSKLKKSRDEYLSSLKCVAPSEIIMENRKSIEREINKCSERHWEKINKVKNIISENKSYASVFELHYKNLMMQHAQFDEYVNKQKHKLSYIYDDNVEEICKKADKIKLGVDNECILFQKTFPAYAYKTDILNAVRENQVTLISADSSYFFNIVTPAAIQAELSDYFVISCENNCLSINWLKTLVGQNVRGNWQDDSKVNFITEEEMLKSLYDNVSKENKFIVIFNPSLKRSIICDLSLAVLRDLLCQKKDSRLILLLSVFEDVKKYERYFSSLKVTLLSVPQLVLPVKTVWKKETLIDFKNYVDEVVCTALCVHFINEPGDILAFLPNIADAKTAIAMFTKKIKEFNYDNVECVLLHKNVTDCSFSTTKYHSMHKSRTVFFSTCVAETISIKSVKYVIDCGLKRDYIFDEKKNLDVMTTVFISRAKAKLRKSLAGIYSPGICYRIYSKENFCYDMQSFEIPDILNHNPFNSLITLFHYQPENALSIQFIEPLDDVLKNSTVIQLKNFNAIKNGKLTQLGKKMSTLLLPVRYSKLILQGIQWGYAFEAVILVAYFSIDSSKVFKYYKNDEKQKVVDAAKLELIQHDSDALSFLYIFKSWVENNYDSLWCEKYHIDLDVLNKIKNKIDEICQHVYENLQETISQTFSDDDDSYLSILEMIFQCFSDNLCVFSGHYRCGYKILSSHHTAYLHPSSLLCNKEVLPQFIIFNKMICSSRNFLTDITEIPYHMVLSGLGDKTLEFDYSDAFERVLVSKVIEPVSEKVIKQILLGKKAKKLLEIETLIKKELNNDLIVIEPSVEKGCIYVYALESILDSAVAIVENILKSNIDSLINTEQTHTLELKKGETTVLVEVKCVMGAKIISAKRINNYEFESNQVSDRSVNDNLVKESSSSLQCSINLTWVRRPCTGICFVNFRPEDFVKARKLATKTFKLLGSEVYVEVSRKSENQLLFSDVPPEARSFDISDAVKKFFPNIKQVDVQLKFSPPFETNDRDRQNIKFEIQENCEEYTNLMDFDVIVPEPKNAATVMTAYVNVFGTEDLSSAADTLSNTLINKYKVTAIPVYRSVIKCSSNIYQAVESLLKEELDSFKSRLCSEFPNKDLFRFQVEKFSEEMVSLKLLSNDIHIMRRLQRFVNELMEGDVLDKNVIPDIHKLFCHGGHMWLRTLEKSKKVYILEEYNLKLIRVYGPVQKCFEVKKCIINFLEDTENEAVETVILSNDKNNRMLLKSIIRNYGVNLETFVELCNLRSAVLDIKSNCLFLHGSRESINIAKETLNQLSSKLDLTEECSLLSNSEQLCPVCASPAFNLTLRLQHCGHLYCTECVIALLEQAQFPVQCCAENCSVDIVLDDIARILDENPEKMKKLLHLSFNDFLERNKSEILYCPAPDCSMFFYKNEVSGKVKCPLCLNDICSECNVIYHHGFTCDMFKGSKEDPDYSFKVWKKGTTECKECPKCKTAIEKNAGCDHMTCISCKAHFCWVCLREFSSGPEVYNHIPFCDKYPKW